MTPCLTVRVAAPRRLHARGRWLVAMCVTGTPATLRRVRNVVYHLRRPAMLTVTAVGEADVGFLAHAVAEAYPTPGGTEAATLEAEVTNDGGTTWVARFDVAFGDRAARNGSPNAAQEAAFDPDGNRVQLGAHALTIVDLDLVGYTAIARHLELAGGAGGAGGAGRVRELNADIQAMVVRALAESGGSREAAVVAETGDGAILKFDLAEDAHRFSWALIREANRQTATAAAVTDPGGVGRRQFRVGIATGEVAVRPKDGGGYDVAGTAIVDAVRLQTAARPQELIVDPVTHGRLPADLQKWYGRRESVTVKGVAYPCHRSVDPDLPPVGQPAAQPGPQAGAKAGAQVGTQAGTGGEAPAGAGGPPPTAVEAPTVREILTLWDSLRPQDQVARLAILVEMSTEYMPGDNASPAAWFNAILLWCREYGKLAELRSELQWLLKRQDERPN